MRRRSWSAFVVVTSSPSRTMRPLVGSMSLLINLSVVDLPQPEGPTRITISPTGTSIVSSSTAGRS